MSTSVFHEPIVERALDGMALDIAAAHAVGLATRIGARGELLAMIPCTRVGEGADHYVPFEPSTCWRAAGLVLDRVKPMAIVPFKGGYSAWMHGEDARKARVEGYGRTMQLAAMRCVAALGPEARKP